MLSNPLTVPECGPFLLPGGPVGCLLIHGFTSMPAEMSLLAEHLHQQGYTVLAIRLAGHASHPADLARANWTDWLLSVEDGLAILRSLTDQIFVIGQSLGGVLALLAASRYPITAAIALSTPFSGPSKSKLLQLWPAARLNLLLRKGASTAPPPLEQRRQTNYPAYPSTSARAVVMLPGLLKAMRAALPAIQMPTLLLHSRADRGVSPDSLQKIYDLINYPDKEMHYFEKMDHSMVRDPRREEVFKVISNFIEHILATHES